MAAREFGELGLAQSNGGVDTVEKAVSETSGQTVSGTVMHLDNATDDRMSSAEQATDGQAEGFGAVGEGDTADQAGGEDDPTGPAQSEGSGGGQCARVSKADILAQALVLAVASDVDAAQVEVAKSGDELLAAAHGPDALVHMEVLFDDAVAQGQVGQDGVTVVGGDRFEDAQGWGELDDRGVDECLVKVQA